MRTPDPAPAVAVTPQERAAVEAALRRRELAPRVRERLEMVKAAARGYDVGWIARWTGRTPETVRRWLAAFGAAYRAELGRVVETPPRDLGLPFDVWTSARLSAYLAERTGTRIAPSWLRALLQRRRFACGRVKHTLDHLRDPAEVAACEDALKAAGGKGGRRAGPLRAAP